MDKDKEKKGLAVGSELKVKEFNLRAVAGERGAKEPTPEEALKILGGDEQVDEEA